MDRLAPRTKYNTFIKHLKSYTLVPVTDPTVEENKLNPRDLLIIQRVKEGRTNKEIAEELNVAEITVKKQLSSLYQRYKVHNRNQLLLALDQ
ncbi:helix-turn-helix transcriptional regulator [Acidaminococcus sp. NSJ-142]|nr:helix-turn-helix transcriptional regulator [Acidaminococcus hominis]